MRSTIFIMMILLPALVVSQEKISGQEHLSAEMQMEHQVLHQASGHTDTKIGTTLIDDRNFYKSVLGFELKKSLSLSHTAHSNRLMKVLGKNNTYKSSLKIDPVFEYDDSPTSPDVQDLFQNKQ